MLTCDDDQRLRKQALRRELSQQGHVPLSESQEQSVIRTCHDAITLPQTPVIGLYAARENEFPTRFLFDYFLAQKFPVSFPRIEGKILFFHPVTAWDEMAAGCFDILAPRSHSAWVLPNVLFVPGMAFDHSGQRLGRGLGYYDRFLAASQGMRVGLCYADQVIASVPCESFDEKVDFLLTERGLICCSR